MLISIYNHHQLTITSMHEHIHFRTHLCEWIFDTKINLSPVFPGYKGFCCSEDIICGKVSSWNIYRADALSAEYSHLLTHQTGSLSLTPISIMPHSLHPPAALLLWVETRHNELFHNIHVILNGSLTNRHL